jgi:hypothetical protein
MQIVQGMNDRFEEAAIGIFVAMVLDGLDGRVARMTKTQSAFGAEFDSLSDMVSFGAAPALVMYEWALRSRWKSSAGSRLSSMWRGPRCGSHASTPTSTSSTSASSGVAESGRRGARRRVHLGQPGIQPDSRGGALDRAGAARCTPA